MRRAREGKPRDGCLVILVKAGESFTEIWRRLGFASGVTAVCGALAVAPAGPRLGATNKKANGQCLNAGCQ
jgi:hypothetical protein